jgi:hypothetical protein
MAGRAFMLKNVGQNVLADDAISGGTTTGGVASGEALSEKVGLTVQIN